MLLPWQQHQAFVQIGKTAANKEAEPPCYNPGDNRYAEKPLAKDKQGLFGGEIGHVHGQAYGTQSKNIGCNTYGYQPYASFIAVVHISLLSSDKGLSGFPESPDWLLNFLIYSS